MMGDETFTVTARAHGYCEQNCGAMDCPADRVPRIGIIARARAAARRALEIAKELTIPVCDPGCGRSSGHPGGDDFYWCTPACERNEGPMKPQIDEAA